MHLVILARNRKGDLALRIHVVLPADRHPPRDPARRGGQRRPHLAALRFQRRGNVGIARGKRLFDGDGSGQRVDLDLRQHRRPPRGVAGFRDDGKQRLAVERDPLGGDAGSSRMPLGLMSLRPGMSAAVSTPTTPGADATADRSSPRSRHGRRGRGRDSRAACPRVRGCRRYGRPLRLVPAGQPRARRRGPARTAGTGSARPSSGRRPCRASRSAA